MDGLECREMAFSKLDTKTLRIDAEFFKKRNIQLQKIIEKAGTKTIADYKGYVDCSAFYPSITGYYSKDQSQVPFLRVNEIQSGLIEVSNDTVFLPRELLKINSKTIALAYPGDIIIAKGGNTLAKVGLATELFPLYAVCRDLIILRTNKLIDINKYYLWAFMHSTYGQSLLWRSASQTGQPHLTLPSILALHVPKCADSLQKNIEILYKAAIRLKSESITRYREAQKILYKELNMNFSQLPSEGITIKLLSESFLSTSRLDSEYYQPKFDLLYNHLNQFRIKQLGGNKGIAYIKKSIEPGSDAYCDQGIPFLRVRDLNKNGIVQSEIFLSKKEYPALSTFFPKKNTILLTKDGTVGIAYKVEEDMEIVTSGAILHLVIKNQQEILPDYLSLVLNSPVVQMQAERDSSGAIIQHWKPSEIAKVLIPMLDMPIQEEIAFEVQRSFFLQHRSTQMLKYAKQAVEIAIEQNEEIADKWLNSIMETLE